MKKPIIGITLDEEKSRYYSKFPWYAIRKNYLHSILKSGGIPFPLFYSLTNIKDIFSLVDGIIITGGNFDINPSLYGKKNKYSREIKNKRTKFEIKICKICIENNVPLLGICGGEQILNVSCGGSLIQDISKYKYNNKIEHEQKNPRNKTSHTVNITKNSKLYKIIKRKKIKVNSAHHQSVKKLGNNLKISGLADDGIIESIENIKNDWCIGVQWHPEFLITKSDKLLISNFVNFAAKRK